MGCLFSDTMYNDGCNCCSVASHRVENMLPAFCASVQKLEGTVIDCRKYLKVRGQVGLMTNGGTLCAKWGILWQNCTLFLIPNKVQFRPNLLVTNGSLKLHNEKFYLPYNFTVMRCTLNDPRTMLHVFKIMPLFAKDSLSAFVTAHVTV